jgi:hypothetical protein
VNVVLHWLVDQARNEFNIQEATPQTKYVMAILLLLKREKNKNSTFLFKSDHSFYKRSRISHLKKINS